MKKILVGLMLVVLFLGACASPVEAPVVENDPEVSVFQKAQDGKPIRFITNQSGHPFILMGIAGFKEACKDYDLLCELAVSEDADNAKLFAIVDGTQADAVSGVVLSINNQSRYPAGQDLVDKGIPLASWHATVPLGAVDGILTRAGPNQVEYGFAAGKAGAEKAGCAGPVAMSTSGWAEHELIVSDSMEAGWKEVCPDTEFLPVIAIGSGDDAKGISTASALLQGNPDVAVAFSTTTDGARWWSVSAQDVGIEKGKILIIGMDATRANLDLVKNGDVWMLVGQPVFEEAYFATSMIVNHLLGYPVPVNNDLPAPQVTLENVDDFYALLDKVDALNE